MILHCPHSHPTSHGAAPHTGRWGRSRPQESPWPPATGAGWAARRAAGTRGASVRPPGRRACTGVGWVCSQATAHTHALCVAGKKNKCSFWADASAHVFLFFFLLSRGRARSTPLPPCLTGTTCHILPGHLNPPPRAAAKRCPTRIALEPSRPLRPQMKLLTHNMLACHVKGCTGGYPLKIEAAKVGGEEREEERERRSPRFFSFLADKPSPPNTGRSRGRRL